MKCIIADDEPIARQIIERYLSQLPNLHLIASCKNALEVIDVMQKEEIDILFLDINMPKLSGISLLKVMQKKPAVIITTAYPEYAIEGFELSVTDYLLKPFSLERFIQAVNKVKIDYHTLIPNQQITSESNKNKVLFVKSDKKLIKINTGKISHVEAYGNYIKICTDTIIITPQKFTEFLNKLPDNFIQIHKSFIINFDYLDHIDGNQIVLTNNSKLPIGKVYKSKLLERINSI